MEIIPAIDLKAGRCVRLYQGDYQKETVYSDDPVSVSLRWQHEGATRLHVVDLDGAASGELTNLEVIKAISTQINIPIQVGGGIRTLQAAETLLEIGADRVVLGTASVQDPDLVVRLCHDRGGDRVVVAVDARDGQVAIKGWTESTTVSASEMVERMESLGVVRFLYTDISRDGTLTLPNFEAIQELVKHTSRPILASGGISSTGHIVRLATIGAEGAILGRALYTGDIDLESAIQAVDSLGARGTRSNNS
jgi:phosphoribosylformimino-5-aminoimidazole carboxamide ribotide isomerase